MKRSIIIGCLSAFSAALVLQSGCADRVTGNLRENMPPMTRVWVDTLGAAQTSRVHLYWSGDDPDGFVRGYFVTVDSTWTFTTSQDSIFLIPLAGLDTLIARFRVAAVDDAGNEKWDSEVRSNGILYGSEPFVDADLSGSYEAGEPFVDLGLVDPAPQELFITINNTPPQVTFAGLSDVPATTFPAASFLLAGTDLDGNETIERYWISLNQPDRNAPGWIEVPTTATLFTLIGDLSSPGDTVPAKLYSGTELTDLGIQVPGMRLDQNNVLYVYCEDLSGASSDISRMPDTSRTWFVKRPNAARRLLLVNDFGGGSPDPQSVLGTALASVDDGKGGSYSDAEVLNIIATPIPAAVHRPMLVATFKLFDAVLWFSKIPNLNYAQNTIPEYLQSGGKVLFATGFQNFIDPQGLPIDFMPIDSLITSYTDSLGTTRFGYISRVYLNSVVESADTNRYPDLVFDRTAIFGTYAVVEAPGQEVIYRLAAAKNPPNSLEIWTGRPAVGILSAQKNLILMAVPLHLMNTTDTNGKNRLVHFLESSLRDEFGL